jgi:hypothetical protein
MGPDCFPTDSEQEVAEQVVWTMDYNPDIVVTGVQCSDGTLIQVRDFRTWPAYVEACARLKIRQKKDEEASRAVETKEITDPFSGYSMMVEADTPEWMGAQTDAADGEDDRD